MWCSLAAMSTVTSPDRAAPLVRPLDDPAADLAQVGGKGASLARLVAAGLPVPPGFHVTTEAYRRFIAQSGLREPILAAVARARPDRPETLEAAAAETSELPVAVRSSATAEDLPELSFAGQQDTYLNIRGIPAVLDAVRRC